MIESDISEKFVGPFGLWKPHYRDSQQHILSEDSRIIMKKGENRSKVIVYCNTNLYGPITMNGSIRHRWDVWASSKWINLSDGKSIKLNILAHFNGAGNYNVSLSLEIDQNGISRTSEQFSIKRTKGKDYQIYNKRELFSTLSDRKFLYNCDEPSPNITFESSLKLHILRLSEYGNIIEGSTPNDGMSITFTLNQGEDWLVATDKNTPITKNDISTLIANLNTFTARGLNISNQSDLDSSSLTSLVGVGSLCSLSLPKSWQYQELSGLSDLVQLRELYLNKIKMTNETLQYLKPLINLKYIILHGTGITDLSILCGSLTLLEDLFVGSNLLSNSSMDFIMSLNKLKALDISGSMIDEENTRKLFEKNSLNHLDIKGINVDDSFLLDLCISMMQLTTFLVDSSKISDLGLKNMNLLSNLVTLELRAENITNEGISKLESLINLEDLTLSSLKLDDVGLVHLAGLSNLKYLHLFKTDVTQEGEDWIVDKIPGLEVVRK